MSYYGVRKLKQVQIDGKWNAICEYYDSSIWGWDGKRDWRTCSEGLYNNGFDTKEELEYKLFQDTLDGNIHGTGGKFSSLAWGSNKVQLSQEEYDLIKKYDKEYWDYFSYFWNDYAKTRQDLKGLVHEKCMADKDYAEKFKVLEERRKRKEQYRYDTYYRRWKEYLANKKNAKKYIVQLNWKSNIPYFVKSHGSRSTYFTRYEENAKIFSETKDRLIDMFTSKTDSRNLEYTNVKLIDVTDMIKGTGKRRHVEFNSCSTADLESRTTCLS